MAPPKPIRTIIVLLGAAMFSASAEARQQAPTYAVAPPARSIAPPPLALPLPPHGFALPPLPDSLLSTPPRNAQAGECFAKVSIRGATLIPPPAPPHAFWVMTPARPGEIGPTFCLYFEPGAPAPEMFAPDRTGWIRVVCDRDLTPMRVRGLQRRLRELGLYQGAVHGRYDAPTAHAVARFQQRRSIPHGGYLSLETAGAIEAGAPLPSLPFTPPPSAYAGPAPFGPQGGPFVPSLPPPALVPPGLAPGAIVLPALCEAPACAAAMRAPYGGGVPPYQGFLSWPGKSLY